MDKKLLRVIDELEDDVQCAVDARIKAAVDSEVYHSLNESIKTKATVLAALKASTAGMERENVSLQCSVSLFCNAQLL